MLVYGIPEEKMDQWSEGANVLIATSGG